MQNLQTFNFQSNTLRIEIKNNEPLFCLSDVTSILNVKNAHSSRFNLSEKGIHKMYTLTAGGKQELIFINEPNLYRVIFRSNKKEAVEFQNWVFDEVLPSIRKTGSYSLTINAQQQHAIREAVSHNVGRTGRTFQAVYHDLYTRFQIPKYQDLLAKDFEAAIEYLGTPQIEHKKRYDFPIETADLPDRQFANALITPRVMLDKRNPAPDLELLKALEQDGYDVTGAKVRIYALYNIVQHLFVMRQDINKARQYLAYVDKIVENTTVERGLNVFFAGVQKGTELECFEPRFL